MIAGCFGILHDQVTYTISPEYFTRMKFDQFSSADFGLPARIFVAEIGFLATWWVGLIGGWFLSRIALGKFNAPRKRVGKALASVVVVTLIFGVTGYFLGPPLGSAAPGWNEALVSMQVMDAGAFYRVAGIHLGSYMGAFTGWVFAMLRMWKSPGDQPHPE